MSGFGVESFLRSAQSGLDGLHVTAIGSGEQLNLTAEIA